MTRDDGKTDELFAKLSGSAGAPGSERDEGIAALREALRGQIDTMRSAENADISELSAEEKARMTALKQQLIDRGLLGEQAGRKPQPPPEPGPSWWRRAREAIGGAGWERPFAVAASVVFIGVLVVQALLPPDRDSDVVRGGDAAPVLVVSDPAATIETLTKQLTKAGADVLPVQINDKEWTLRVSVPKSADRVAIKRTLEETGIEVLGEPPYKVGIKAKQ